MSVKFTKSIYQTTAGFPDSERYGLVSQLRRASVSVPSNIAEGWGRGDRRDYARFLRIARGSLFEIQTQLIIARDLGFIRNERYSAVIDEVDEAGRVLAGLLRSIESKL